MFFSEEKNQKTFISFRRRQDTGPGRHPGTRGELKVFCFFFSKKKGFLTLQPSFLGKPLAQAGRFRRMF
jgi:hypothetical protein